MGNGTYHDGFGQLNGSTQTHRDEGIGIWATVNEFGPFEKVANLVFSLVCVAAVVSDLLALYVVNRGRRFPRFCRILSMNYLVSDMLGAATFAIHNVLIYVFGYTYEIVIRSRSQLAVTFVITSSAFVTGISLERVMSLVNDLKHRAPSGSRRITTIVIAIWGVNVGIILTTLLLKIWIECQWDLNQCYIYEVARVTWYLSMALLLLYDVILIVTNLIIHSFVRRHKAQIMEQQYQGRRQTNSNQRQLSHEYEILKTIAKIIMSYLLLHIPLTITVFIHEWYAHLSHYLPIRFAKIISYLFLQVSSFVHLYYYVFKLKENKVNMYILLSRVFPRLKPRAEKLRMDVFNIPASSDRATRSNSSGDS